MAAGVPDALTVNATATPAVVLYGPAPPVNAGAVPAVTTALTVCVATPAVLLAVILKTFVVPPSACGGV